MRSLPVLLVLCFLAPAQTLLHQTFESSTADWKPLGEGSTVHSSGAALAFEYTLAPKHLAVLVQPAPPFLAQAGRIRFSVKADHSTAMAALLMEKKPGGGNYMAWFWAPANQWQAVELTPADFTVTDGPQDPVDSDGRLDLDAVEAIGILDLAQFFGTLKATSPIPVRIDAAAGSHTFLLNHFDLLSESTRVSPLDRGFVEWVSPGGMDLKLSEQSNPLGKRAIQAAYQHRDGEFDLLLRRQSAAPSPSESKGTRLVFDIASEREVTLMLSLEMKKPGGGEGPRFTLPIYPPGGREVFHVDVKLSDFEGPGKFDPNQWRTTAILDITDADGANTLWLSDVHTEN